MSKGKLLAICFVWLFIVGVVAVTWRFVVSPVKEGIKQNAYDELIETSGSSSQYDHVVNFGLDSFSGYAVFRSNGFADELKNKRIGLNLIDDGADYTARLSALQSGACHMAVFTIDALIKASADLGEMPATIVAIVDETRGADAMVAYKNAIPNVDALNRADVKFVLTPSSPSETLSRVVMTHFNLDNLGDAPFEEANDAEDVFKRYRASHQDTKQVFVLWEPYVSKVLENPNTHVVVDSSRFRGYIVDVVVVNRNFLLTNPDVVQEFVASYFKTAYDYRDTMTDLVIEDAKSLGEPLTPKQAENLVAGVWWKNTQENFAHIGIHDGRSLQHLEDMIDNITDVLVSTGSIQSDPTNGKPSSLFYDKILRELKDSNFHPALNNENVRNDEIKLSALSEDQWTRLMPVGTLEVPKLVFGRGTSRLTGASKQVLDDLIGKLNTWPQYYVSVHGNASTQGDLEANKALAQSRAQAAAEYLKAGGISSNRIRAVGGEPSGTTSVSFVLGQTPY